MVTKGESARGRVENAILLLAARGPLKYTDIIKSLEHRHGKGKYAKLTILKYLHTLLHDKRMEKGQGTYRITQKGLRWLLQKGAAGVSEGLRSILALENLEPSVLDGFKAEAREAFSKIRITEEMPKEEREKKFDGVFREYWGLLARAYYVVHKLVCQLGFDYDGAAYLGFTADGDLEMIREGLLKQFEEAFDARVREEKEGAMS